MHVFHYIREKSFSFGFFALILFLLSVLAYGLVSPFAGFHWDDWIWVWVAESFGPLKLLEIDAYHRPGSGLVLALGGLLFGANPFGWQVYNLLLHWGAGVALYFMLSTLWPRRKEFNVFVAGLFLFYPGFSQQFVAVNSSRHIFPLALHFLSFGFTLKALKEKAVKHHAMALGLMFASILTSEYFYGAEFLRFLILLVGVFELTRKVAWRKLIQHSLPYGISLIILFGWRYSVTTAQHTINYQIDAVDQLSRSPLEAGLGLVTKTVQAVGVATGQAWARLFQLPTRADYGLRILVPFWILFGVAFLLMGWVAQTAAKEKIAADDAGRRWLWQPLGVAVGAVLVAGVPFLVTSLPIKLAFPADRATLPYAFGASLLLVAIFFLLPNKKIRTFFLIGFLSLAVANQFRLGVNYVRDAEDVAAFFEQLAWRAPEIEPDTILASLEMPIRYSTDDSLTGPLNLLYQQGEPDTLPLHLLYLDLRVGGGVLTSLEPGTEIKRIMRFVNFKSNTDRMIVFSYEPLECLHILSPIYDVASPVRKPVLAEAIPLSNLALIHAETVAVAELADSDAWCYYYQMADIARQNEDWAVAAEIGDIALGLEGIRDTPSERLLFIEAYARTGEWKQAETLSRGVAKVDPAFVPNLCALWQRVGTENEIGLAMQNTYCGE